MNNFIKKYWEYVEKKKPPKYCKTIKIINSKDFFNTIENRNKNKRLIYKLINTNGIQNE